MFVSGVFPSSVESRIKAKTNDTCFVIVRAVLLVDKDDSQLELAQWRLDNNLQREAEITSKPGGGVCPPCAPVLAGGLGAYYGFRTYKVSTTTPNTSARP